MSTLNLWSMSEWSKRNLIFVIAPSLVKANISQLSPRIQYSMVAPLSQLEPVVREINLSS